MVFSIAVPSPRAQELEHSVLRLELPLDTGWVLAPAGRAVDAASVVLSFPLEVPGARWLRLRFDEIRLGDHGDGAGAVVRLTSAEDGAVQTLSAAHARQWSNTSAYFNGDAVRVEIVARPGSTPSRLVLRSLDVGVAPPLASALPCSSDDERVPSDDPRVGRLLPQTCTAWIIDDCERCLLTAGHCVFDVALVQFDVPLSDPDGSLNHPHPRDQYAVDFSSLQSSGPLAGLHDWAYFGLFPNPITGLTPFEAQGAAFTLIDGGAVGSAARVRVTGYGGDTSPSSHNEAQQTDLGPVIAASSTSVSYDVDNGKGNSGSPVVWDEVGVAVAIHTLGVCLGDTLTGAGTAVTHPALQAALAAPRGVCDPELASADPSGTAGWFGAGFGLFGTGGVPELTGSGALVAGAPTSVTLTGAREHAAATLVIGFDAVHMPFKFGVLVPRPDALVFGQVTDGAGSIALQFSWPAGVPVGTTVWWQFWLDDPGGPVGWSSSNALASTTP